MGFKAALVTRGDCPRVDGRNRSPWSFDRAGPPANEWAGVARSAANGVPSVGLWRRAWLLEPITAEGVGVGNTHIAASIGAWSGLPFPSLLRRGRPVWVEVRVEIGLRVRRHRPAGGSQNAHGCDDKSTFHSCPPLDQCVWTKRRPKHN